MTVMAQVLVLALVTELVIKQALPQNKTPKIRNSVLRAVVMLLYLAVALVVYVLLMEVVLAVIVLL